MAGFIIAESAQNFIDDSGRILAIIGIDIDAHTWKQAINLYRYGSIGIMLLLVALVLVYFLSLLRINNTNKLRRVLATELTHTVDELSDTNKDLESFSYSVSHDLRAPLRHIQGYSEALYEDCRERLGEDGLNYLQRLCHAADSMERLIQGLLKLSRVSKQDLNVTQDLVCFGDSRLLRIVLDNLLTNAYKYSYLVEQPRIEFGATQVDKQMVYYVNDNGVGFDMAYNEKLFEPFQRLHSPDEFEGCGIGLSTVARIIRRHKGRIWAEGKPNEGAKFYFTLGFIL